MTGSCLCGQVAWEVDGGFELMSHCHCSMCRKKHGTAFATYVAAPEGAFRWLRGGDRITRYESSPGFIRPFCPRCGSTVPGDAHDGRVFMPAGCLDGDPGVRPLAHIFVASKAPWWEIQDDLPRFDAYPPGAGDAVERPSPPAPSGDGVTGSCLCGGVAYTIEGRHQLMVSCHCSRCRKGKAAAHGTNLLVPSSALRFERGEELVRSYSPPGAVRFANPFCSVCGSIVPRIDATGGIGLVPAGGLDQDPGGRQKLHIFVGSKADWYEIPEDGVPRFEEAAPAPPPSRS
jgi:hypothetical protein